MDVNYAPKQKRSARTLDRLLDSTERILRTEGVDAATIPRIAARAELSVGVVYRRFPHKEAVLQTALERYLTRSLERMRKSLDQKQCKLPLRKLVRAIVGSMIRTWRADRGMLRALHSYLETSRDPAFQQRIAEANAESLGVMCDLLLAHRRQIKHPRPTEAIQYGLMYVALVLKAVILTDARARHALLPPDSALQNELTRLYLNYLGTMNDER